MTNTTEPTIDEIFDAIEIFEGDDSYGKEYQSGYNDMALACRLMKEQIRLEVKQAVSNQVAKAKLEAFDIAFDSHDYDGLREYRASLIAQLKGESKE